MSPALFRLARRTRKAWIAAVMAAVILPAAAQSSASFEVSEVAINNGGNPMQGSTLASPSFRVTLDAIGDAVTSPATASGSVRVSAGFPVRYGPPGEVSEVRFTSDTLLAWDPEVSAGTYSLYRGSLPGPPGGFGACHGSALPDPSFDESAMPVSRAGWFYLVTAVNRLDEEGTKGESSSGVERPNATPCP